ncbi:HDIG domain-containing protein [Coprothermobacteraceae bacterium]|nr:HDIG domain-containing protein [Coprothermobacteraceae bacterium]
MQDLCPQLDLERIERIYEKYKVSDHVRRHIDAVSIGVARVVRFLLRKGMMVNACELLVASLLHDVGRAKTHNISHGVIGAEIAIAEGYEEPIPRMIERHIGAGLTAAEAKSMGLPPKDYVPVSLEEKILAAVDNLAMGDHLVTKEEFFAFVRNKFGSSRVSERFIKLYDELSDTLGVDLSLVVRGENT